MLGEVISEGIRHCPEKNCHPPNRNGGGSVFVKAVNVLGEPKRGINTFGIGLAGLWGEVTCTIRVDKDNH